MITRIHISGYKSLRAVEAARLGRIVLLYGPNAAGKSNFLDALDLLAHLARSDDIRTAFDKHRGNRTDRMIPVKWLFSNISPEQSPRTIVFSIDLEIEDRIIHELNEELIERETKDQLVRSYTRATHRKMRYELEVTFDEEHRTLEVTREYLTALDKQGQPLDPEMFKPYIRHEPGVKGKKSPFLVVKQERQSHPRHFELPRTRTILSEISDIVNHPHIVALARELAQLSVYYVEPTLMRGQVTDLKADHPGSHGQNLASFYYWLQHSHKPTFNNLIHNMKRLVPELEGIKVSSNQEGFLEFSISERGGTVLPAALASEGTLRLLCLLGIAASPKPPTVCGYEEPENGVNPQRLREMLDVFIAASKSSLPSQFFLTTHSDEVIRYFSQKGADLRLVSKSERGTELKLALDQPLFHATL